MSPLADRSWPDEPTRLDDDEASTLTAELSDSWHRTTKDTLVGEFSFDDFEAALAFTQAVGELAEELWHHPELYLTWGEATVTLTTHDVGGLSLYDFIMAARIDEHIA